MKYLVLIFTLLFIGCNDSNVVSSNISTDADNFKINRRIIFYNGITDKYIFVIEGFCSIEKDNRDNQLEVTCKVGKNSYKKHYLGISDNVTYFIEQLDAKSVDAYHYKVIFKPQTIIPDIDVKIK